MAANGVCGDELGEAEMKGVPGLVELVHVFVNKAEAERRAHERMAGVLLAAQQVRCSPADRACLVCACMQTCLLAGASVRARAVCHVFCIASGMV